MEVEFRHKRITTYKPPGSLYQILEHPFNDNKTIELALFQDHRYAFYYWNKWNRKSQFEIPPCLVSLDWHQDLCYPCETEKKWLEDLNLEDDGHVAFFSWAKLALNNDGHILSAAYLNLIGNIYVHCRQGTFESEWEDEEFIDMNGNIHIIKKFKKYEDLERHLLNSVEKKVFFDIDLDFFTLNNPYNNGKFEEDYTYLTESEIFDILNVNKPLIKWVFERLEGFTVATEPKHCGGLFESNRLLDILNRLYFDSSLFVPYKSKWKHKN